MILKEARKMSKKRFALKYIIPRYMQAIAKTNNEILVSVDISILVLKKISKKLEKKVC